MVEQRPFTSVNPRLKTHFAIFTSAICGLFMLLVILEQLGLGRSVINYLALLIPLILTGLIGLACTTNNNIDYFIVGRRVPGAFSGFTMACSALGSAGFLGFLGAVFFLGFDALAISLGWALGFALLAILFAPYVRKMGTYTLPGFFSQRYNSSLFHFFAALVVILVSCMLLIAEIQLGAFIASFIFDVPQTYLISTGIAFALICLIGGGMRSLTWSQCAQFLIVIIGFLVILTIVAIQITNLPIPQLTYGNVLDDLAALEQANGLTNMQATSLSQALPSHLPAQMQKPFAQNFGLIDRFDFIALTLCFMFGTATLPILFIRLSTTPDVSDARRSVAWGLAFIAILVISVPAYAVFTKLLLFQILPQFPVDQLPEWITELEKRGALAFANTDKQTLDMSSLNVSRDAIAIILPFAAGFPYVLVVLAICCAILLAIAGTSAQIVTLANSLSHDVLYSIARTPTTKKGQIILGRFSICVAAALGLVLALGARQDSLLLLAWALSITGSAFFAPLLLSIWWKKCTKWGALGGMLSGLTVTLFYIWLTQNGATIFGIDGKLAGTLGIPISFITAITISMTAKPEPLGENERDVRDEIHIPGGEAIYDRVLRIGSRRRASKMGAQ